ncbi:unnamed protein product [Prorocentrum cordatum]|uniref:Uncharacterized protein n=1 Tax=Prorocentrum cordatum TaxID=2364126 RepID=A0ABN9WED8_9DINO|nr:unnamed protein product [Polarella glacialis]
MPSKENVAPDNSEVDRLSSSPLPVKNTFIHYDATKTPLRTWTGDKLASPQTVPPNFAPEEGELLLDRPTWPPGPPQLQGGAAASLEALGGVGGEGGRPSTATWPLSVALAASAAAAACPADGAAAAVRQQGAHRGIAPLKLFDALNLQTPPCAAPTSVAPSAQALAMPQNPLQAAPQAAAVFQDRGRCSSAACPGSPSCPWGRCKAPRRPRAFPCGPARRWLGHLAAARSTRLLAWWATALYKDAAAADHFKHRPADQL